MRTLNRVITMAKNKRAKLTINTILSLALLYFNSTSLAVDNSTQSSSASGSGSSSATSSGGGTASATGSGSGSAYAAGQGGGSLSSNEANNETLQNDTLLPPRQQQTFSSPMRDPNYVPGTTTVDSMNNGASMLRIPPPGVDRQGKAMVSLNIAPWLLYDFNGDGSNTPKARLDFGIFNSDSPIIYRRQTYR